MAETAFDIYRPFIQSVVKSYPSLMSHADDIAQDVMLVLMRELPTFNRQRTGSFRTFPRQITVNQLRTASRKSQKFANNANEDIALSPGDTIDNGPFSLDFDGKYLISRSRADNVQLCCSGIDYEVNDNNTGKKIQLLLQIELVFNPGEFVCILGPSGSGKSTLLNLLSGRRLPNKGNVYLNGRDLHRNFAAMKQDLAVVPQSTDLYRSLTVEQSFRFTSELRLPTDLGKDELKAAVDETLQLVGLEQRRHVRISHLSGGQLKRAGLGSELLAEPTLLFLDEVTSGLDEHSDSEMIRLFRSLADRGKTLVCITHNLSHVEDNYHLVAVLTVGGRLAFLGTPGEAMNYFRVKKLADIYLALQTQDPESWATSFLVAFVVPEVRSRAHA